jgi:hypothetical protein
MTDQQQPPADFELNLYICRYKKQATEGQAPEGQAPEDGQAPGQAPEGQTLEGYFHTWSTVIKFNGLILSDSEATTLVKLAYGEMAAKSSGIA